MEDIADLGLAVHSDSVPVATDRLNRMKIAASQTEIVVAKLIGTVGKIVAAYATWQIAESIVRKYIAATAESERVQTQLAAALKSTGSVAGQTIQSLNAHADALKRMTSFDDEAINGAQALLLTFTKIRGDTFPKATEAVLNLATAMHTDLQSAAIQVGKALNDPILGMTALTRSGIQFTEQQKAMVKHLVESNDMIGAQKIILKELENQFGGSARAARGTLGGALSALSNAFDDLFEATGPAADHLRDAVEGLIDTITDPGFIQSVQEFGATLFNAISAVLPAIREILNFMNRLGEHRDQFAGVSSDELGKQAAELDKTLHSGKLAVDFWGGGEERLAAMRNELANRFASQDDQGQLGVTPSSFNFRDVIDPKAAGKPLGRSMTADQIAAMEKAAKDYDKLTLGAHQFIEQQQLQAQTLGRTAEETSRLTHEQELLNKAANDNIALTPAQRKEIEGLAASMASAEEHTRQLTEAYEFGKDALNGFFSDLKNGLQEGKSLWEAFGNAAGNVLNKIADKALGMAADGIWDMIFGAVTGGLGSVAGGGVAAALGRSVAPSTFDFGSFLNGHAAGTASAPPGLAWVGEKGPELMRFRGGEQIYSNSQSATMAANQNGGATQIEVLISVDQSGNLKAFVQQTAGHAANVIVKQTVPGMIEQGAPTAVAKARRNKAI